MPAYTVLGHETEDDLRVLGLMTEKFGSVVFFLPLQQWKAEERCGYWHIRCKGQDGIFFVRKDWFGCHHVYGPVKGEIVDPLSE